jgi:FkbM family methyltransferase
MKKFLRSLLLWPAALTNSYFKVLGELRPAWVSVFSDQIYAQQLAETTLVTHESSNNNQQVTLILHTPNTVCRWRAESFSTKEPETLAWIDEYGGHGAFFDVGANVGLYSLYYAKLYSDQVYAFEPSVFNLGILVKNVYTNSMSDRINVVPIPLSAKDQIAELRMSGMEEGGALSSFGVSFGHDGRSLDAQMTYRMPGLSLDSMLASKMISELPSLIKIDVDGIEHLILSGASLTLRAPTLVSVLVEVNDEFRELASEVARHLTEAGFAIEGKYHAKMFDSGRFATSFNQIWVRPESYPV